MEKLRQALKTLSEAEKQLRMSNDKLTWLTAALLQLAPDQQYTLPTSSADTSFNHSPLAIDNLGGRDMNVKDGEPANTTKEAGLLTNVRLENFHGGSSGDFVHNNKVKGIVLDRKRHGGSGMAPHQTSSLSTDVTRLSGRQISGMRSGIEEIWTEMLKKIQNNNVREFLHQEGKLISVSFGAGTFPDCIILF